MNGFISYKVKMSTITTQTVYTDKAVEYIIRTWFFVQKKEKKEINIWSILKELWLDKTWTSKNKASKDHDKILYWKK